MGVGDGSIVADELGAGDNVGATDVLEGATVGGGVTVGVWTTKRVTVGGIGVVNALTANAVRVPRLAKANTRQTSTTQNARNRSTTRLTWLPGTRLRSNCMGIRVYHSGPGKLDGAWRAPVQGLCRDSAVSNGGTGAISPHTWPSEEPLDRQNLLVII